MQLILNTWSNLKEKMKSCGSFKFMAVVKVLFQAFLKLNYFIEAVKPFHPKGNRRMCPLRQIIMKFI